MLPGFVERRVRPAARVLGCMAMVEGRSIRGLMSLREWRLAGKHRELGPFRASA